MRDTIGFRICSYIENVTKRIPFSKKNIHVVFNEAKINRLKKIYKEEQFEKQQTSNNQ